MAEKHRKLDAIWQGPGTKEEKLKLDLIECLGYETYPVLPLPSDTPPTLREPVATEKCEGIDQALLDLIE